MRHYLVVSHSKNGTLGRPLGTGFGLLFGGYRGIWGAPGLSQLYSHVCFGDMFNFISSKLPVLQPATLI